MKLFNKTKRKQGGYVAIEFVVAMGFLVLPTMMVVLQIPSMLEKKDRLDGIAATIAQDCANDVDEVANGQNVAVSSANRELAYSSSFRQSNLRSATCVYEAGSVQANTKVTARIEVNSPSVLVPGIPGLDGRANWVYRAQHSVIIPRYRSFEE